MQLVIAGNGSPEFVIEDQNSRFTSQVNKGMLKAPGTRVGADEDRLDMANKFSESQGRFVESI